MLAIPAHRLVDDTGAEVAMSSLEFDLLKALAEHPNRPLSRERIGEHHAAITDGLPKFADMPAEMGGSGVRCAE